MDDGLRIGLLDLVGGLRNQGRDIEGFGFGMGGQQAADRLLFPGFLEELFTLPPDLPSVLLRVTRLFSAINSAYPWITFKSFLRLCLRTRSSTWTC